MIIHCSFENSISLGKMINNRGIVLILLLHTISSPVNGFVPPCSKSTGNLPTEKHSIHKQQYDFHGSTSMHTTIPLFSSSSSSDITTSSATTSNTLSLEKSTTTMDKDNNQNNNNINDVTAIDDTTLSLDPLLLNILYQQEEEEEEQNEYTNSDNTKSQHTMMGHLIGIGSTTSATRSSGLIAASKGIQIWRMALSKGRLPTIGTDFLNDGKTLTTTTTTFSSSSLQPTSNIWPPEPLFSKLTNAMIQMELARFVSRHPETITSVLISIIRMIIQFSKQMEYHQEYKNQEFDNDDEEDDDDDDDEYFQNFWNIQDDDDDDMDVDIDIDDMDDIEYIELSEQEIEDIANTIATSFEEEWRGVVTGTTLLDQLFGLGHDILEINQQDDEDGNISGGSTGFGLQDGIWKHTGWEQIPQLQQQILAMPELRDLLNEIGRRPTSENSDRIHKFAPRKLQKDGGLGAQFDPQRRESVNGITLSGNLAEMLPSEAVLLRSSSSSSALRRLFLAKMAESKLLSYQLSGWTDVPSVPLTRPLYSKRMPSAPGGPIIVCLDTSWSMSGKRELLSKSVVLACVSTAHKQKRDCQVVAFSTERGIMEAGIITADAAGTKRLLDFLSHSFGGGTDVTGALKFAMTSLDSEIMAAADILMITDGEIPDPPVSNEIMEKLDHLKFRKGVEVHGLLVGKKESKPLSRLSTKTHNFLSDYDLFSTLTTDRPTTSRTLLRSHHSRFVSLNSKSKSLPHGVSIRSPWGTSHRTTQRTRNLMTLHAKRFSDNDDDDDDGDFNRNIQKQKGKNKKQKGTNGDISDDYDDSQVLVETGSIDFSDKVEQITQQLMDSVRQEMKSNQWNPGNLETERTSNGSCWQFRDQLRKAIGRVGEGLVEREEESRLVVLAMLANEHILFLGVPGTGKSVLGRRLSKLCNGTFFQRLLTRFTTPEELFGPLSLRSLENDEYRRCTNGFLPTASVAFLDEIFKANSAILNTLLTILNERKFDNAGGQERCPIRCVVGASNELPESDELVALFDRFLIRKEVYPVSDDGVMKMLSLSNPGYSACDSNGASSTVDCDVIFSEGLDEVVNALSNAADNVYIDNNVCELMRDLRAFMKNELNAEVSDRRLVKAARLLKLCAATDGRNRVDPIDCLILQHCMWQLPEQRMALRDWLWESITPGGNAGASAMGSSGQFRLLLDGLRSEAMSLVRKTSGDITGESGGRENDVLAIKTLREEVDNITDILKNRRDGLLRHLELVHRLDTMLWIQPEDVLGIQQFLSPRAEIILSELDRDLTDAMALGVCLSAELPGSPPNDKRLDVIETLWEEGFEPGMVFTEDELDMGMKEAKAKYDLETFRKWKRARKKAQKA